jgi:hypothetical protein
MLYSEDDIDAG